jgi:alanine racemase
MDLIAVDVTDAPAKPGDRVQLLGPEVPVDEAAAAAGTLAYEFLVRLSPRLRRTYVGQA